MKSAFLILAAGKSSRFGGYPKAFCKINGMPVVQRTVELGSPYFDETYLAINRELYSDYQNAVTGCKTFAIGTGQGDAHSFLRAARRIKEESVAEKITLCWGDTFYLDDGIFKKAAETEIGHVVGVALCAVDPEPYAWFETDGDRIKAAHFRAEDGAIEYGIHDQSVFVFHLDTICAQLESYMEFLGIRDNEDYNEQKHSKEMKLLESFAYFYKYGPLSMEYSLVESGKSYSFNTHEELEKIRGQITAGFQSGRT